MKLVLVVRDGVVTCIETLNGERVEGVHAVTVTSRSGARPQTTIELSRWEIREERPS